MCITNKKITVGYVAPCILRYHGDELGKTADQYEGKDIVLLGIWKTRCFDPRVDIILWLPHELGDKKVVMVRGHKVGVLLRQRYCDLEAKFDVKLALR